MNEEDLLSKIWEGQIDFLKHVRENWLLIRLPNKWKEGVISHATLRLNDRDRNRTNI